jgi:hypothetical protein
MVADDHRTGRGGLGRPVGFSNTWGRVAVAGTALAAWLAFAIAVTAHGGVPRLQLQADRINPGGSLELRGDMTGDEPVELTLEAGDGSTLALGSVEADWEGHFVTSVTIPADTAAGTYVVRVTSPFEEATTRIVVAGPPLQLGEEGQPLGQDEARAGPVAASSAAAAQPAAEWSPPPGADSTARVIGAALVVVLALVAAFGFGRLARLRSRRA